MSEDKRIDEHWVKVEGRGRERLRDCFSRPSERSDLNEESSSSGAMRKGTDLRDVKDVELVGLSHYVGQCVWGRSWI